MKITILKLLDRIIPHRRSRLSNRNKAEAAARDQSQAGLKLEYVQFADRQIRGVSTEAEASPDGKELEDVVVSASLLNEHSPAAEANLRYLPEVQYESTRLPKQPLQCQIVRGGILGINDRRLPCKPSPPDLNLNLKLPEQAELPAVTIPVGLSIQEEEEEEEEEESNELDRSSRYPLCKTCQTIMRRYASREWYAPLLSTKKPLQERASKGCPLCMLYLEMVAPYSNYAIVIASATTAGKGLWKLWNSDVEGTSATPSQTTGQEIEELLYKRDSGSKLVLHFLSKKYTIVFDRKYSWVDSSDPGNSFSDTTTTI
jgi:hypothetical protein